MSSIFETAKLIWVKYRSQRSIEATIGFLQNQPLMKEYWTAEHRALEIIFNGLGDVELNNKIATWSDEFYRENIEKGHVPVGQEEAYRDLYTGNAMRMAWDSNFELQEEMASYYAQYFWEGLDTLGVSSEFRELYVGEDGKSRLTTTYPDEPYLE